MGSSKATTVGPVTWIRPYRFPPAVADLYAESFNIKPCGAGGSPIPNKGLAPGEFFTDAIVTVNFATPSESNQQGSNDPNNLQQLDPNNPITMCEQSIKIAGKMETRKAGSYMYTGVLSTPEPVLGDFGVLMPESKLVLTFPRVPYLPRKLIKPYIGTVNSIEVLQAAKGELLLEGMDTKIVLTNDGENQQIQLEFAESAFGDWNMVPDKNGAPVKVYKKGTSRYGREPHLRLQGLPANLLHAEFRLMPDFNPPTYKRGDPWRAEDVQAIVAELKRIGNIRGGAGVQVRQGAGGTQLTAVGPNTAYLGVATADIAPAAGTTPGGPVDVTLWWIDTAGPTMGTLGITVSAYNPSTFTQTGGKTVKSGQKCWVQQDPFGVWMVAPLECTLSAHESMLLRWCSCQLRLMLPDLLAVLDPEGGSDVACTSKRWRPMAQRLLWPVEQTWNRWNAITIVLHGRQHQ